MDSFFSDQIADSIITIANKEEIKHITKSLRKTIGSKCFIIDGQGNKFLSKIIEISNKKIILEILQKEITNLEYDDLKITIAIAKLNNTSKYKLLIQKLVELGVSEILFFPAEYSSFPKKNIPDLEPYAIEALKQCGGVVIPKIKSLDSFEEMLLVEKETKLYCQFGGEGLENFRATRGEFLIVIGPEGGFSEPEIVALDKANFKRVSLNKRILRAETAAIIAAGKLL